MFPSSHHKKQDQQIYGGYGGCGANYYNNESFSGLVMSQLEKNGHDHSQYSHNDLVAVNGSMAEDESRTNSLNNDPELPGSSSKPNLHHRLDDEDQARNDQEWLQLSVGGRTSTLPPQGRSSSGLIELDLLSSSPSPSSRQFQSSRSSMPPMFHVPDHPHYHHNPNQIRFPNLMSTTSSSSLYFQHPLLPPNFPQHHHQITQEANWGLIRPLLPNHRYINKHTNGSSSTSSSNFIQMGPSPSTSYFPHPFQLQHHHDLHHGVASAGRLDFRVVDPPRRPQSGIWFMLQASQNQEKEPFLPQIPKSYLRIKDGRMTVRLIKKYVVNKLRLDTESEVEITCRGQQLQPSLTLQYVRDNIWSLRDAEAAFTLLPLSDFSCNSTSTDDHVMVLHYARTSSSSIALLD